jgi:hypothetical protein
MNAEMGHYAITEVPLYALIKFGNPVNADVLMAGLEVVVTVSREISLFIFVSLIFF